MPTLLDGIIMAGLYILNRERQQRSTGAVKQSFALLESEQVV